MKTPVPAQAADARPGAPPMRAAVVRAFGGPEVIGLQTVARPQPAMGQILVRVTAAGVGRWDAAVRSGDSPFAGQLPLVLGAALSGVVAAIGPGADRFQPGMEVYGATNRGCTGAYAEYALAEASMVVPKPAWLDHVSAAALPVAAASAWQMVFEHGHVASGQTVLVTEAASPVGAFAVQIAKLAGARVIAFAPEGELGYVRDLGADHAVDLRRASFRSLARQVDVVLDNAGGGIRDTAFAFLKPGGVLVSSVSEPGSDRAEAWGVRAVFVLPEVTAERLKAIAALVHAGRLKVRIGEILPLEAVRLAHEMLAGGPRKPGQIVLDLAR